MKLMNPKHPVQASWIRDLAFRMDASPFISGALEARKTLEALSVRKDSLNTLTAGFDGGIFNGPHFSRTYVDLPEHGVPFLGSSDMLNADLSNLQLLRKKEAFSAKLRHLELKPGMTLISCSGTIGNTVYCRDEMKGMWSSQHVMKVVPDERKVPPGFLYAFISSKYGIPIVVSGTYGSIIQSIGPEHIATLPVPRFGARLEQRIHDAVVSAGNKRTKASSFVADAIAKFYELLGVPLPPPWWSYSSPLVSSVTSNAVRDRLDAFYFAQPNLDSRTAFDTYSRNREIGAVARVFIPGIFKRRYAEDPQCGLPYLTGADVFNLAPTSDRFLMRSVAEQYGLRLAKGMLVIQEAGQLSGIIGRAVMVGDYLDGFACSNNMVRIVPNDEADAGFIFAAISSEHGVRLIKREGAGSSIPHLERNRVANIRIPWPDTSSRRKVSELVNVATRLRDEATMEENAARELIERAIEENA